MAMLHQRRPRMCERSRNSRVQTAPSQALMLEKSSLQTSSAMVSATGSSSVSAVCQRLICRQATPERTELSRAGSRLTIWPNSWSRSRMRFNGARSFSASGFRGLPFVLVHKAAKPLSQGARLRRDGIQLSGKGRASHRGHHLGRNEFRGSQPVEKIGPRAQPFNGRVHRRCDRIEEVQCPRVANEDRWGARINDQIR